MRPGSSRKPPSYCARLPNAKILAGGQSLVPMMNFRYVIVDHLVDLGGVDELRDITVGDGRLRIGAMTRQRDLELLPEIAQHCPLMAEALRHVGHRQTRNRGTIGGSLAHADPAAELPAVCAAYGAVVHVASVRGIRQVPFREFSTGFMATVLAPDEMIAAVDLPTVAAQVTATAFMNSPAGKEILRWPAPRRCSMSMPPASCGARHWRLFGVAQQSGAPRGRRSGAEREAA